MRIGRWNLSVVAAPRPLPPEFEEWLSHFRELAEFVADVDSRLKATTTLAQKLDKRSQRGEADAGPEKVDGLQLTVPTAIRTGAPPPAGFGGDNGSH